MLMHNYNNLSNEQLANIAKNDNNQEAISTLLYRNEALIYKNALALITQVQSGLDLEDLLQAGRIGMLTAINKYDISQGNKFVTYATWWIRAAIKKEIASNGRTIRVPINESEILRKIKRLYNELDNLNITKENIIVELQKKTKFSKKRIIEILKKENLCFHEFSANEVKYADDNNKTEMIDFVADDKNVEHEVFLNYMNDNLYHEMHKKLNEREIDVLIRKHGLFGTLPESLTSLSKRYMVSKQNISAIEASAKRKLRNSYVLKQLLAE